MSTQPTSGQDPHLDKQNALTPGTISFHGAVDTDSPTAETSTRQPPVGPGSIIGQTFNDLQFLEELGRGGMGVVFKAKQKNLNRMVAVKLLLSEYQLEPVRLARFQAEARAAASLNHNNIVQVYGVGQCPVGHYFTMEYINGQTLEAILRKRMALSTAVHLMILVAQAVHYAHTKGIVHRDLKPGNILVDQEGRPVITDFGIAKIVGKATSFTKEGVLVGTPAFMSPEQAGESLDEVGPRSDVYALGAILYNMLCGRLPFDERTPLQTVLKVISPEMPPSLREIRAEVPPELEHICMKCLRKQPAERYQSAERLALALRRFRAGIRPKKPAATMERKPGGATMRRTLPSVLLTAPKTGEQLRISGKVTIVGRSSECGIVLRAADVSKKHCRILIGRSHAAIEDLESANGTYVNGKAIQRSRIKDGDRLRIAEHEFEIRLQGFGDSGSSG
jgi:serine/threonine protein kinase